MRPSCRCPSCKCADALEEQKVIVVSLEQLPMALVWAGITLVAAGSLDIPAFYAALCVCASSIPWVFALDSRLICQRCQVQFLEKLPDADVVERVKLS